MNASYGVRRVYEVTPNGVNATVSLRLKDRVIELGRPEFATYEKVAEWLTGQRAAQDVGMEPDRLQRFLGALTDAGLLYQRTEIPDTVSGEEFHRLFGGLLQSWLQEAFSHPFWERMMTGKGSARLFAGWMIELYHYTRNANRHMPLSCAHTRDKAVKGLRARHYAEEWNHYHYFMKSLKALAYDDKAISQSVPLPMTLALSNFMRQAAREDILCYSVCSAVLEGTTVDRKTYGEYYEKAAEFYQIPRTAIQPIYAHLDLDIQYQHSDLFADILKQVPSMSAARAGRILDYGHGLVEHIWMWTDNIEKYYGSEHNPVPRLPVDPFVD